MATPLILDLYVNNRFKTVTVAGVTDRNEAQCDESGMSGFFCPSHPKTKARDA
jgi:hypothetical protein